MNEDFGVQRIRRRDVILMISWKLDGFVI